MRETTVPSAIQALLRATLEGSVTAVVQRELVRRQRGVRRPVTRSSEPADEGDGDERHRDSDGDPQCCTNLAGPDVEVSGGPKLLAVG